jgi:hypothetical protein
MPKQALRVEEIIWEHCNVMNAMKIKTIEVIQEYAFNAQLIDIVRIDS